MRKLTVGLSLMALPLVAGVASSTQAQLPKAVVVNAGGTCASINAAIQSLPSTGGLVRIEAGKFVCDEPVVIDRDNVVLEGAGRDKTLLINKDLYAAPVLVIGVLQVAPEQTAKHGIQFYPVREVSNIEVRGMTLDGNLANQKPAKDNECFDVEKKQSLTCDDDGGRLIRNNGVTIRRASNVRIIDVAANRNCSGGMVLEKHSKNIMADGFYAAGNAFDGFAGYETHDSLFKNVVLEKNLMSGISVDFEFDNNTFDGLKLLDNGDNGIFSHSVNGNIYKNALIKNNKNFGAFIDGHRTKLENGDWQINEGTCDNTQFINVAFIKNGNEGAVRFNSICRGERFEDIVIRKLNPEQQCIAVWPGTEYTTTGKFDCK